MIFQIYKLLQKHVRKVIGGFAKKSCVSTSERKARNHMRVTDHHDTTFAVKVALNPNKTNQSTYTKKPLRHNANF